MNPLSFLQNISLLLVYVIPGYVATEVKNFLLPTKRKDSFSRFLESVLLSYIIVGIIEVIYYLFLHYVKKCEKYIPIDLSSFKISLLLLILGVLTGYISAMLLKSDKVRNFISRLNVDFSFHPNVWNEQLYKNNGECPFVRVYLENERVIYDGFVRAYTTDPNEDSQEIYLIGYRSFSYEGDLLDDYYGKWGYGVLIKKDSFSRMEFLDIKNCNSESVHF